MNDASAIPGVARDATPVVGINRRNVDLVYANNPREFFPYADDKLLAKSAMIVAEVSVPPTLAVCRGLFEVEATLDELERFDSFVVKPASGSGGDGILVVARRIGDGRWESVRGSLVTRDDLRKQLADIVFGAYSKQLEDVAFVEPRIVGHPVFVGWWSEGLCDVRVIVLRGTPVMAMVRVPTQESSGRANLHQGGIGLAVDLATGVVTRAYHRGASIERHPESGAVLVGVEVPAFARVVEIAVRAASSVPLGYLGVDLVVDERSEVFVLEINARPGLEIQNVHGKGLADMISDTGEEVTPPSRRASAPGRRPVGDRALPIVLAFAAVLVSAVALEVVARAHEPSPLVIAVHSAGDSVGSEDEGATVDDAPAESSSSDPDRVRARMLAHRGELEEAIAAFRASLERFRDDLDLRSELAYWLIAAGKPTEALDELRVGAELGPSDARVALYAGHAHAALGDGASAEREYRRALAARRDYGSAAIALARLLLRGRRFAEAREIVQPATTRGGNAERARALVVYGAASIRLGERDAAERAFASAIDRAPALAELRIRIGRAWLDSSDSRDVARAIGAFEGAIRIAPDVASAYSGLGRAYEAANDDANAERAYDRCLAIDPGHIFARRRLLRIALASREFRRAESHSVRLLAEDETNPEHHFLAGLVAAREGHVDDARARYLAAIEHANGNYPEAYFNLGQLESRSGRRAESIAAYEHALANRPRYAQAMNNLGLVLEADGRPSEAEVRYRDALAIDANYATALVNLGTLVSKSGRHAEGIALLRRALAARHGDHPQTEIELADALERAGLIGETCDLLDRLVAREPRLPMASLALGAARARNHDPVRARAAYEHVLSIDSSNADALRELGRLEASVGELDGARTHLRESLDVDSTNADARLALADVLRRLGDAAGCSREVAVAAADRTDATDLETRRRRCAAR